jgi:hypothetical protein
MSFHFEQLDDTNFHCQMKFLGRVENARHALRSFEAVPLRLMQYCENSNVCVFSGALKDCRLLCRVFIRAWSCWKGFWGCDFNENIWSIALVTLLWSTFIIAERIQGSKRRNIQVCDERGVYTYTISKHRKCLKFYKNQQVMIWEIFLECDRHTKRLVGKKHWRCY